MAELYKLLVDIRYIERDLIHYAPHTDPPFNLELAQAFHFEPQVVELLQLLPYPFHRDSPFGTNVRLLFESRAAAYLYDGDLMYARDPRKFDAVPPRTEGPGILHPWEIPLTFSLLHGVNWLLDTRKGTIQSFPASVVAPFRDLRPGDDGYFEVDPPVPAAETIRELTRKYRELDGEIPMVGEIVLGNLVDYFSPKGTFEALRRRMVENYGWPDNFRREAWQKEAYRMTRAMGISFYYQ